jgi:hypothetical protein
MEHGVHTSHYSHHRRLSRTQLCAVLRWTVRQLEEPAGKRAGRPPRSRRRAAVRPGVADAVQNAATGSSSFQMADGRWPSRGIQRYCGGEMCREVVLEVGAASRPAIRSTTGQASSVHTTRVGAIHSFGAASVSESGTTRVKFRCGRPDRRLMQVCGGICVWPAYQRSSGTQMAQWSR